ncbi:MAG: terpene cyclase/mutase family protein [Bifidobacteriaceae bacterium]|jgi:hypothetical protein|nr:terpene cyclase/mutase family protein [Bifidobacteriaceae bacterium]
MQWIKQQGPAYSGQKSDETLVAATAKLGLALEMPELGQAGAADQARAALRQQLNASGQFVDRSSQGDFSTPTGQSLAILLFHRAADWAVVEQAASFLASSQCADGGFPVSFAATADCTGDPDSTAFALFALFVGENDSRNQGFDKADQLGQARAQAAQFMLQGQDPNGLWAAAYGPSVNTTAMAASALTVQPELDPEVWLKAVTALADIQNDDGGLPVGQDGASDLRATAQAALFLADGTLLDIAASSAN